MDWASAVTCDYGGGYAHLLDSAERSQGIAGWRTPWYGCSTSDCVIIDGQEPPQGGAPFSTTAWPRAAKGSFGHSRRAEWSAHGFHGYGWRPFARTPAASGSRWSDSAPTKQLSQWCASDERAAVLGESCAPG